MTDDDTPTDFAPTELAAALDSTEAHTAWSLDDVAEEPQRRSWLPVALALVASLALLAGAGALAYHLRGPSLGAVTMDRADERLTGHVGIEVGETGFALPSPPPPTTVTRVVAAPSAAASPSWPSDPWPPAPWTASALIPFDQQLIRNLRARGWVIWDEAYLVNLAHLMCGDLMGGISPYAVRQKLVAAGRNPGDADQLVRVAMNTYPRCP